MCYENRNIRSNKGSSKTLQITQVYHSAVVKESHSDFTKYILVRMYIKQLQ